MTSQGYCQLLRKSDDRMSWQRRKDLGPAARRRDQKITTESCFQWIVVLLTKKEMESG